MTQFLPPNLLALFAPRDPLPFIPPPTKLAHEKKNQGFGRMTDYKHLFEDPKDTPAPQKIITKQERLEKKKKEKIELATYKVEQGIALWNPQLNTNATSDPFKTLFVGRLNYDTTESKLRREFEVYGPIKTLKIINDRVSGKPRGYAFIEFKHERDMHAAYKRADGKKIEGRRVLVDVERGRTVKGWLPRRLGGGLGGRKDDKDPCQPEGGERGTGRDRSRSRSRSRTRSRSRDRDRDRDRGRKYGAGDRYGDKVRDRDRERSGRDMQRPKMDMDGRRVR